MFGQTGNSVVPRTPLDALTDDLHSSCDWRWRAKTSVDSPPREGGFAARAVALRRRQDPRPAALTRPRMAVRRCLISHGSAPSWIQLWPQPDSIGPPSTRHARKHANAGADHVCYRLDFPRWRFRRGRRDRRVIDKLMRGERPTKRQRRNMD